MKLLLLVSGKRKSGKDFICEKLKTLLSDDNCILIQISGPLKKLCAENHNLDWAELMSDGPYKEKYRLDMITWSDEVRRQDPGYFCRAACKAALNHHIWVVSDIRRKSDIKWFKENYNNLITLRISADTEVRKSRGWAFKKGVDDATSECDLDDYNAWDLELTNNNMEEGEKVIQQILDLTKNI